MHTTEILYCIFFLAVTFLSMKPIQDLLNKPVDKSTKLSPSAELPAGSPLISLYLQRED